MKSSNNIKILSQYQKTKINKIKQVRELKLLRTKSDEFTIKVDDNGNKLLLHSYYDPQREAERLVNGYSNFAKNIWVVFGFGCGYHVENLLNKLGKKQKVKVIIINPDIFKEVLFSLDLSQILDDSRVDIILELDVNRLIKRLDGIFNSYSTGDIELLVHKPSLKMCPKEFLPIKDTLEEISIRQQNTTKHKDKIKKNILSNLPHIKQSIGVNKFNDLFSNKPIFIVSAGPSLDKNIHHLKDVGDKGIIISVDTAIPVLKEIGVNPDFIAAIDPNQALYDKIFKKHSELKVPIIYIASIFPEVLRNYQGPKVIGFTAGDRISSTLDDNFNKGKLEAGGSVASTALDFAYKMGGNPLVFVGQDLAFTDEGITHAKNTFYDNKKDVRLLRKVPGSHESEVRTSSSYYIYLRWIERFIQNNSDVDYIDATEGGARIKGTKICRLKDVIDNYCQKSINKTEIINTVIKNYINQDSKTSVEEMRRRVKEVLND